MRTRHFQKAVLAMKSEIVALLVNLFHSCKLLCRCVALLSHVCRSCSSRVALVSHLCHLVSLVSQLYRSCLTHVARIWLWCYKLDQIRNAYPYQQTFMNNLRMPWCQKWGNFENRRKANHQRHLQRSGIYDLVIRENITGSIIIFFSTF